MAKIQTLGFGFLPLEAQQHFLVDIPPNTSANSVAVYERFSWDDDIAADKAGNSAKLPRQTSELPPDFKNTRTKIILSLRKWNLIKGELESGLNRILRAENKKIGHFRTGQTPVERLLGKEMMVLLWAIEDCDPSVIPNALCNWNGLSREERWWLFTMTNAATGDADAKRGWRIALRYAITENPVTEKTTAENLFASLSQRV